MAYEPNLITPFVDSGLSKYFKPFIVEKTAFPSIENAYPWRGSVRKREGFSLFGTITGPVQGLKNWVNPSTLNNSLIAFNRTQSFIWNTGTSLFDNITFYAFGGPAQTNPNQAFTFSNGVNDYFWSSNYAGSLWVTNNLVADHIKFWNGTNIGGWSTHQPTVSGTTTLDSALIVLPYKGRLVALNTTEGGTSKFPSRARWSQIGTPYTSNASAVAITGITTGATTLINVADTSGFTIGTNAGVTLVVGSVGVKLNFNQYNIINVTLNTSVEIAVDTTGLAYVSGGFLQGQGSTAPPAPFSVDIFAWRDDIAGRGGFNDADTSERIVSAEIVRDTLIVCFQRSTWRLRYTNNEILPFIWERINTQYGAESTYSNVAFDDAALFFSRYGWIGSDTNSVGRIDENIPDDSFSVEAVDSSFTGLSRVQGIRDFYRQMAYWTFESVSSSDAANKIYAYNYIDKSWAVFTPSVGIRTFGYFYNNSDYTWASLNLATDTWAEYSSADSTWSEFGSGQNTGFPFIVGGDVQGNIYQMFEFFQNPAIDAAGTASETNFNFSITTKRFNPYLQQALKCRVGYVDIYCTTHVGAQITLQHFVDDQNGPVIERSVEVFSRGVISITAITPGPTTLITVGTPHNIPAAGTATVNLSGIYGSIASSLNNQQVVATYVSDTTFTVAIDTTSLVYTTGGYVWTGPFDIGQVKYVRVFLGPIAHMHQFVLTLSDPQLEDPIQGTAQFELQALVVWTRPMGRIRG
jgi:hypothetical protein